MIKLYIDAVFTVFNLLQKFTCAFVLSHFQPLWLILNKRSLIENSVTLAMPRIASIFATGLGN